MGETSQLVLEYYGCNTSRTVVFWKIDGEEILRYPYKNYSSLNRWQANWVLLYVIYYSVTTHLRQGKKVSFLPLDDVNFGPIPLR
jgi:ABC-type arginine transport system permease subunit